MDEAETIMRLAHEAVSDGSVEAWRLCAARVAAMLRGEREAGRAEERANWPPVDVLAGRVEHLEDERDALLRALRVVQRDAQVEAATWAIDDRDGYAPDNEEIARRICERMWAQREEQR